MKKINILLVIFVICLSISSFKVQKNNGQKLYKWSLNYDKISATNLGIDESKQAKLFEEFVESVYKSTFNKNLYSIPDKIKRSQLSKIVSEYLKNNPERYHYSADKMVLFALQNKFPNIKEKRNKAIAKVSQKQSACTYSCSN